MTLDNSVWYGIPSSLARACARLKSRSVTSKFTRLVLLNVLRAAWRAALISPSTSGAVRNSPRSMAETTLSNEIPGSAGSPLRPPNSASMPALTVPLVWRASQLQAGPSECIVERLDLAHPTTPATRQMAKVSRLQPRMGLLEGTSEEHVRLFKRPHFDTCTRGKCQC